METTIRPKDFETLRAFIYKEAGIVLADSKQQMVQARLQKRIRVLGLTGYGEYLKHALETPSETVELINAMTTNKTDFFREPHHFEFLARQEIPRLIEEARRLERPKRLRIWHAGCSTGEEPYSMAMVLAESPLVDQGWDIRQLASDIDTKVLAHSEAAIYDEERISPVSLERRRKFFLRGKGEREGQYQVRREIRELVTFRQINLLDPTWPMSPNVRFDVIFCRNVIIYFDRPTQAVLFDRFASKLQPGGLLIIGHSENLHGLSNDFDAAGTTIYRLRAGHEESQVA